MTETKHFSSWTDTVVYDPESPAHQTLMVTDDFRAILVGLQAGQRIPPHPSTAGAYHFLEGTGWMQVENERFPVAPGATIVVPAGAARGVEAQTKLAFLGTQAVSK